MSATKRPRWALQPIHVAGIAVALALLNLALRWPGELDPDSRGQFQQAITGQFTDWHPPMMAVIWRWLLPFDRGPAPMLVLQVAFHWLGIGLLAASLCRRGSTRAAALMLLGGLTPIALKYTGAIQKDTLLASLLLAAFGLAALNDVRARAAGIVASLLGTLFRANGIFASPPLIFLALRRQWSLPTTIVCAGLVALLMMPLSQWINHAVLGAQRTGVERALQLYDLVGIAYFADDPAIVPVQIPDLKRCYLPLYADTLKTPRCDDAFSKIGDSLTRDWLAGIAKHPAAYFQHRLAHFNREIFFLVPPAQQCVDAPEAHDCPKSFWSDFLTKNALLWPVTWLALGVVMLLSRLDEVPRALCLSALLYGFGYLVVGVAADFRYFYWTELAIQSALIFQAGTSGFHRWRAAAITLLAVWSTGYAWRYLVV